jgi:hypothetical protein
LPNRKGTSVQGHLDRHWTDWFAGLRITHEANGTTTLAGPLADQTALHGVLIKIRDLGLPLLAVATLTIDESPNDQQ